MASPELEYKGLRYRTETEVYAPHDDTWLLVEAVRTLGPLQGKTVVEVGCGAGLGLLQAVRQGADGVGVDRNRAALRLTRANARSNDLADRVDVVQADLVGPLDLAQVDVLLFNPPYLPTEPHERLPGDLNLAFDGGPTGNETLFRFADALAARSDRRLPELILVTSSLNDRAALKRRLAAAGFEDITELGVAAFPFERLFVERFTRRG